MSQIPKITERRVVASNHFFNFAEEDLQLSDGQPYTYYQLESNFDAVVVVPMLPDGRLIVERIYRHPYRRFLHEFPAGGIQEGEDPLAAGARELEEETGWQARSMQPLEHFEAMPGLLNMGVHLVLATDLVAGGTMELEAMEDSIEVLEMDEEAAWSIAREQPASSFLIMGLLALSRYRLERGL
jgi:8-oxo-dGTP pyrophosphatase MutT (NUDIX family)